MGSSSFLQSKAWGDFQSAYGRPVQRIETDDCISQSIVYKLPLGKSYLFTPYGPVGKPSQQVLADIKTFGQQHQAIFWRYERGGIDFGGMPVADIHPKHTFVTTLQTPDQMLAEMKQKWRYNIHLAQRKGVKIYTSQEPADVAKCFQLLQLTAEHQDITIHPLHYYELMLKYLGVMYFAEYNNEIIATAILISEGDTMTYVHGGSDYAHHTVMAPHLLHWQALQDAFAAGYKFYDWFGVGEQWPGISRFKRGFGGVDVSYDGTFDLPLHRLWYDAYRLIKHLD